MKPIRSFCRYIRDMEKGDSVEERNYKAVDAQRTRITTKIKTIKETLPKLTTATQKLQNQVIQELQVSSSVCSAMNFT